MPDTRAAITVTQNNCDHSTAVGLLIVLRYLFLCVDTKVCHKVKHLEASLVGWQDVQYFRPRLLSARTRGSRVRMEMPGRFPHRLGRIRHGQAIHTASNRLPSSRPPIRKPHRPKTMGLADQLLRLILVSRRPHCLYFATRPTPRIAQSSRDGKPRFRIHGEDPRD